MEFDFDSVQAAVNEAFVSLVTSITLFVPRLINAAILLLLGWLLGKLVSTVLDRLLKRVGFDRLLERGGLDQILNRADISVQPSTVISRLVFWLLLLTFLLAAVDALGLQTAAQAIRELLGYIPNLIAAVLVMIGGGLLARFLGQTTQTLAAGANLEFHRLLGMVVQYFFLALAFLLAFDQLGLDVSYLGNALTNLVTVFVAMVGLALALGGRDIIRNVLAGFYAKEMFALGQQITVQQYHGTLEAIGPLKAQIVTSATTVSVPNTVLTNEVVTSNDHSSPPLKNHRENM